MRMVGFVSGGTRERLAGRITNDPPSSWRSIAFRAAASVGWSDNFRQYQSKTQTLIQLVFGSFMTESPRCGTLTPPRPDRRPTAAELHRPVAGPAAPPSASRGTTGGRTHPAR